MGECRLDRIGVREANDDSARMTKPDRVERGGDADLHLGERLSAREPKRAGCALDRGPLGFFHEVGEFRARPVAEVAFDEALVDDDALTEFLRQRCGGLAGAFEGGCVDRIDLRECREPLGDFGGLFPAFVAEVQTLCATRQ